MAGFLNLFGLWSSGKSSTTQTEKTPSPPRALPSIWYTSPEMFSLERRAVFAKQWLLTTHRNRFQSMDGKFLRLEIMGWDIVLWFDEESGMIRGAHNICRHRGYPVVTQTEGKVENRKFKCGYHGWRYRLDGSLSWAHKYPPSFDKSKFGLIPIHVHVDRVGRVFVNLDGSPVPETSWEEQFGGTDVNTGFEDVNMDDYEFHHEWEMEGPYNWKLLADNYNECYHCKLNHPQIGKLANLDAYDVTTDASYIQHHVATTTEQLEAGLRVNPTYFFPNASMNITPHFFFIQRFVPIDTRRTVMRYEVYKSKQASEEQFTTVSNIYRGIMSEDKDLCIPVQKNMDAGVFVAGRLHPELEKGPIFFQRKVREAVEEHRRLEKLEGREIWPSNAAVDVDVGDCEKEIDFCNSLSCEATNDKLSW